MRGWASVFALAALVLPEVACAQLTVNAPRPITYEVKVQLIQTALDDGSERATVFGNPEQRAAIESRVDSIWAQAGIDIQFLPNVVQYNNTFAYQGTASPRPSSDLSRIISDAASASGVLHPDPNVLDMFFVNVVPGWSLKPENWANGTSNVGANGISEFIGDNLLITDHGLDTAAHWIAHEIGHNLGLFHTAAGVSDLMSSSRTTDQLNDDQISAIFQTQTRNDIVARIPSGGTGFPQLLKPFAPGDFNRDGRVNAADITMMRDNWGSTTNLLADSSGNGVVDVADWNDWKSHFNASAPGPALNGDFDHNGVLDAADYTMWADNFGSRSNLVADANNNNVVDFGDYAAWLANSSSKGSGGAQTIAGNAPEPATWVTAVLGAVFVGLLRKLRSGRATQ